MESRINDLQEDEIQTQPTASDEVIGSINDMLRSGAAFGNAELAELGTEIARYSSLPEEYVRLFPSPQSALEKLARTYLEQGAEAAICTPADGAFEIFALGTGARIVPIRQDDPFDPQIEAVINHIGPRTRIAFIENPNPITGAAFTEAELVFLLAYAEGTMIVVSERFFEFGGLSVADLVRRFPNLAVLRSISSEFGMGPLSLGYILSDPINLEFIDRLYIREKGAEITFAAALAALKQSAQMQEYVKSVIASNNLVARNLPELGFEISAPATDFLLVKVSDINVAMQLLRDEGIEQCAPVECENIRDYLKIKIDSTERAERLLMALGRLSGRLATGFNRNKSVDRMTLLQEAGRGAGRGK
jgi:histidinol-phosphate aminotransferase